ncbi:MAG: ATP-dependent DNA helicase RecQ, partial [Kiritimatiellae bacterium]|nr:ATP-dependent DNA helicase RecQ [Kiritimatiellia bacterium]
MATLMDALYEALNSGFGFTTFRPGQELAIRTLLAGKDALVVMPTGSGKSLCFQLPALLTDGTVLVVSPLIALMKDQVDALTARHIPATFLNSTLTASETAYRLNGMRSGRYRLVYVAPERFRNPRFLEAFREMPLHMLAIDEAHCISTWGHDFRPDYLHLEQIVADLPPNIRILAVTATATEEVRHDIVHHLGLGKKGRQPPEIFVTGFARPNLHLNVTRVRTQAEKLERVLHVLETFGTGIIYCATRRAVEQVQTLLKPHGHRITTYHGAMADADRTAVQNAFMHGTIPIVAATNAFGMGVDRPDIRFVIHWDVPGSIEAYYQEVGRAGRDGAYAWCELLFSPADVRTQEFFITAANPPEDNVYECYSAIRNACYHTANDGVTLSPEEWSGRAGLPSTQMLRSLMAHFERAGLIFRSRQPGNAYSTIRIPETFDRTKLKTICDTLLQKDAADRKRLRLMLDFVSTRLCRHRFLLTYFGEPTTNRTCAHCDRCSTLPKTFPPRLPLSDERRTRLRKILSSIARMKGKGDWDTAIAILLGTATTPWKRLSTFGLLADTPKHTLLADLHTLDREGCLSEMTVTPKGYDLIKERLILARFMLLADTPGAPTNDRAPPPRPT